MFGDAVSFAALSRSSSLVWGLLTWNDSLAYAEMHIALATVLRRFGDRMELFETGIEDVRVQRDFFVPKTKVGTKGVRVLISSKA